MYRDPALPMLARLNRLNLQAQADREARGEGGESKESQGGGGTKSVFICLLWGCGWIRVDRCFVRSSGGDGIRRSGGEGARS